jgi:hypothetical protein
MTRRLLLAGEGPDELGRWFREKPYREPAPDEADVPGILEALLTKLDLAPWEIADAVPWRDRRIPLYRAGERRAPETRRVLGLALLAAESDADAVVFVRDRDGEKEREADIEAGISQAPDLGLVTSLAGGVAIEEIEAWILALLGDRNAESHARPKERLAEEHGVQRRTQKVAVIEAARLEQQAQHAPSLVRFLNRVRAALGRSAHGDTAQL